MFPYALLIAGVPVIVATAFYFYLRNSAHTVRHFSMAATAGILLPILFHLFTDVMGLHNHEDHAPHGTETHMVAEHKDHHDKTPEHGESNNHAHNEHKDPHDKHERHDAHHDEDDHDSHAHEQELLINIAIWAIMGGVFWAFHSLHGVKSALGMGMGMTLAIAAAFHHVPEGILFAQTLTTHPDDLNHLLIGFSAHHFAEALAIVALLIHENKSIRTIISIFAILVLPLYAGMALADGHLGDYNIILSAIGAGALAHVIFDTVLYLQTQGKTCCSPRYIYAGYATGIVVSVALNTLFSLH